MIRTMKKVIVQYLANLSKFWNLSLCILLISSIHHASSYKITSTGDALEYLSRFGYVHNLDEDPLVTVEEAREGVREFQELNNLIPNGRLNRRTIVAMNKPRCGNRDLRQDESDEILHTSSDDSSQTKSNSNPDVLVRKKRYDLQGPKWRKKVLTYRVAKFASSSVKPKTLQNEIDLAFKYWEREANLTFKKVWNGKADIEIGFFTGDHGDKESFDGPSQTLAHAFYPTEGVIHFDDEERWTASKRNGHNLRTVAVHEIGHALGLGHSKEKRAVMFSMYQGFKEKLQLHEDDISAIQTLYGPKVETFPRVKISNEIIYKDSASHQNHHVHHGVALIQDTSENPPPDLCTDPKIDAISTFADGHVYAFKGSHYFRWKMGHPYSRELYPKRINETFHGLPSNLDTVLTVANGKTYFFKGRFYWRSTGTLMDKGYPKRISTNFLGIPDHLDGSVLWSKNNMIYFFKKNRYWRYSFENPRKLVETEVISKQKVSDGRIKVTKKNTSGYPRKISPNWPTIPNRIEDAFTAPNGSTYFFKKGEYWKFDDPDSDQEAASYPRSTSIWWFGCTNFSANDRRVRHFRNRKMNV